MTGSLKLPKAEAVWCQELYAEHAEKILGDLLDKPVAYHAAWDALHQAFFDGLAAERAGEFATKDDLLKWLGAAAQENALADHRKEIRFWRTHSSFDVRQATHVSDAAAPAYGAQMEEEPDRDALKALMRRALAEMPERRRQVYICLEAHGMSYPEVQAQLQMAFGTVQSHANLARAQLREFGFAHGVVMSPPKKARGRRR